MDLFRCRLWGILLVALLLIGSFLAFLKKKPMRYFAVYRIVFAFIVLIAGFFGLLSQVSF